MTALLNSGLELMLVGMGIVFAFLSMLVFAIKGMSALILRHFPDAPAVARSKPEAKADQDTIAAISAAVHHYRNRQQPK